MRSHKFRALLRKDLGELFASRAWWFLLVIIGPLVGQAFISAVNLYAEASGIGGGPAALPQALTPLDGIFVPAFGAYDLAVTLLFPFIAIRLISGEKESGGHKLLAQFPVSMARTLLSKAIALFIGWVIAWVPAVAVIAFWKAYGGSIYTPELLNLILGHVLRVSISAAVAVSAAAIMPGAANAAIVALAFTVGTWVLEFVAMGRGGLLEELAALTPTSALRSFEHGQLKLGAVLMTCALTLSGFLLASFWLQSGRKLRERWLQTAALAVVAAAAFWGTSHIRTTWDISENRRNSFSVAEEAALRRIREPLHISVHLAAEDPRLMDLERNVLSKLERIVPNITVDFSSTSRTGMFENAADYGEIWYELGGRTVMNRSTTEPIVLETVFTLANSPVPPPEENSFAGHPLAARPKGATIFFYLLWPVFAILAWGTYWRHKVYEADSDLPRNRPRSSDSSDSSNQRQFQEAGKGRN